tara:strand:- start:393 stop:836 length:444 start_codon:yes stop_codon:yes gene_type:complete
MSSVHLYQAEKKDLQNIYDLLIEFKEIDLIDLNLPDVDKSKLTTFINTILQKGKVILAKDLDKNELIGICMFHKSEFWFSKGQMINIHVIYIKKNFRSYKLFKTMIDSVKKIAKELPIVIGVTTGLKIDPVFERLGFENMGSNWRLL